MDDKDILTLTKEDIEGELLGKPKGYYLEQAVTVTLKHTNRVRDLLKEAGNILFGRGLRHDESKFSDEEIYPLARMQIIIDAEGQAPFGSDEYKRRTAMLKPMLEHHYANNSHHPEHYENGVSDMDLFDVMEMFFDWKAASERGEEHHMSINKACDRFKISDQLRSILINTAKKMEYKYE